MSILNYSLVASFYFLFSCNPIIETYPSGLVQNQQNAKSSMTEIANPILQSTDGGNTWTDISEGLPEKIQGKEFFIDEQDLYLFTDKGMYHSKSNLPIPKWKKEQFLLENGSIAKGQGRLFAFNYGGQFLQKINATGPWFPVYPNFKNSNVRNIFETTKGTVFIGCDEGLFKSSDNGKTWKHVQNGWVIKMIETKDVLIATSQRGIIRSTDEGENWELVINEGGVGIAIEQIKDGFAAITYNTTSETRRIRTSYDNGKTWQPIDAGLRGHALIASIKELGDYFYCGHPDGIFRSSDKGKTWKLILCSIEKKIYNLSVAGNVIYAIPREGGC